MENAFEIIPAAGLIQELDLNPGELQELELFHYIFTPNLILEGMIEVKVYGMIDFQVEIIEVIPPDSPQNETFFKSSFSDIYAEEDGDRKLTAWEVERSFELKGRRWILIGGILNQVDQVVPPATIIAYYEQSCEAMYTIYIKDELQENLFKHTMFRPLN